MKQLITLFLILAAPIALAQDAPEAVHPGIGTKLRTEAVDVVFVGRKQHFENKDTATLDVLIHSPKSVNIHPSGNKFYVHTARWRATRGCRIPRTG